MPHGRGLPSGERPSSTAEPGACGRQDGPELRRCAIHPRGWPGRVREGGTRLLLHRLAVDGDAAGGGRRERPQKAAPQTLRVCKGAPFSLPLVGPAPAYPVALKVRPSAPSGSGEWKVYRSISRHPSTLHVGSGTARRLKLPVLSSSTSALGGVVQSKGAHRYAVLCDAQEPRRRQLRAWGVSGFLKACPRPPGASCGKP